MSEKSKAIRGENSGESKGLHMSTSLQMFVSVAFALLLGGLFGEPEWAVYPMKQIGGIFVDLLKMTVVPIAFVSITGAVIRLGSQKTRKLTFYAAPCMLGMSFIGVALGIALMGIYGGFETSAGMLAAKEAHAPTLLEFIRGCIPVNPVKSFAEGNMLQVLTCAFFVGAASLCLKERDGISAFFDTAQAICLKVTSFVIKLAPIGAFCLLYPIAAKSFGGIVVGYLGIVIALAVGSMLYMAFVSLTTLRLYGVENPLGFMKVILRDDIIGAISGGATNYLAPRIANLKAKTSIDGETVDYLLPLLAVLMRAGSCICVGIYTVFAASVFGVDLTTEKIIVCILLSVIALTAAPGIIGGTLMDCAIIWAAIGIPLEAVALLAGIDYVMDVIRTVLNIQGGEIVTACVDAKVKQDSIPKPPKPWYRLRAF